MSMRSGTRNPNQEATLSSISVEGDRVPSSGSPKLKRVVVVVVARLESSNRLQMMALLNRPRISNNLILSHLMEIGRRVVGEEDEGILNLRPRVRMLVLTRMVRASRTLLMRRPSLQIKEGGTEVDVEARLLRRRRTLTLERT